MVSGAISETERAQQEDGMLLDYLLVVLVSALTTQCN
jgi:hypothetical protein